MKKIKPSFFTRIYLSNMMLLLLAMLLIGLLYLYSSINIKQEDLNTTIKNFSQLVSEMDAVQEGLKKGEISPTLASWLDLLVDSFDYVDILVICNENSIRLYHTNPEQVGRHFQGGDEGPILEGAAPYISRATGTMGLQQRSFHSIRDDDGNVIGFVMASIQTINIDRIRLQVFYSWLLLLLFLLPVSLLVSAASVYRLKRILMGYAPEEFSNKYMEQTEVMDALEEGIFAINTKGQVILMNLSAKKMLELDPSEPTEGRMLNELYPETQLPNTVKTGVAEHNINFVIKNQNIISSRIPVRSQDKIIGAVSIFRNKTEVTRLAEELTGANYMVDTLRAFNHEFMNKLHVILGLLEMSNVEGAKQYILQTSLVSGQAVSDITHRVPIANVAALLIGKLIRASELGIQLSLKPDSYFYTKSTHLPADCYVTLIGNLVENAMDELNSGPFPVKKIELGIYSREGVTIFCCDDTGGGIPQEILASIYDRGTTTKGAGHGNGFALMKEIVDRYHGSFHIDTEPGEGTSIEIVLQI